MLAQLQSVASDRQTAIDPELLRPCCRPARIVFTFFQCHTLPSFKIKWHVSSLILNNACSKDLIFGNVCENSRKETHVGQTLNEVGCVCHTTRFSHVLDRQAFCSQQNVIGDGTLMKYNSLSQHLLVTGPSLRLDRYRGVKMIP